MPIMTVESRLDSDKALILNLSVMCRQRECL